MNLSDLVGEHILTAVDFGTYEFEGRSYRAGDIANFVSFTLDGETYVAQEDPSDGYRSCLGSIEVSRAALINQFPPVRVIGRMREAGEYEDGCDILQLVDAANGKIVLEVGTSNKDDYYPSFVSNWNPKNLSINDNEFFRDSKGNL